MAEDKSYVVITEDKPLPNGAVRELMIPLLAAGQEFRFRARGASMSPFIRDGDVLTVSPLAIGEPRVADVVAVFDAEKAELIIHRVIDRRRSSWLIRGDNTDEADGYFEADAILGKVRRVERQGLETHLPIGPFRFLIAALNRTQILRPALNLFRRARAATWRISV